MSVCLNTGMVYKLRHGLLDWGPILALSVCFLSVSPARAVSESPERDVDEKRIFKRGISSRAYDEVFDTELPVRYQEGAWSLHFKPRLGGWLDDDYMRLLVGARYIFSRHFDAYTNLGSYFPNPINDGDEAGLYIWELGARYSWLERKEGRLSFAAGLKAKMPIFDAPYELIDGYARYSPYVTVSHKLRGKPNWLYYLNASFEFVDDSPFQDHPIDPQPKDRFFLRPGLVYYAGGPFRYSVELEYITNALDFRDVEPPLPDGVNEPPPTLRRSNWILAHRDVHELLVYPAITWFPSRQTRDKVGIPGNWDLGLRVKIPVVEETGRDFGLTVRFRWYFDHRKFIQDNLPAILKGDY
ncbi:hypothetical protein G0Q06_02255 [Puniceicoccales bacterium CK1056]|uniref:Uncharacterized protein n=1 Tax=Oceanipulchritudo coccoides TaxID=2706888 RepID=A0A6B2LXH5_9BACT|nr:hypothetical protein [Oceanipulchritudo coccoides]NDV61268.1 hypothetical protein [Oceanipulchritudo coccoides]